jgi:hypothetical protein
MFHASIIAVRGGLSRFIYFYLEKISGCFDYEHMAIDFSKFITEEEAQDPRAYVKAHAAVMRAMLSGEVKTTEGRRLQEAIKETCLAQTSIKMEDQAKRQVDPLITLVERGGLLDCSADELKALKKAIEHVDGLKDTNWSKKKVVKIIHQVLSVQEQCRAEPVKAALYYGRDQVTNQMLKMSWVQMRYYDTWNDTKHLHSLVMAPPGHTKSASLTMQAAWDIGDNPNLRCLIMGQTADQGAKAATSLKRLMQSKRYHALFPNIRIMGRLDGYQNTQSSFTVERENLQSREPTVEGAALESRIEGNGYDMIYCDDIEGQQVREQDKTRRTNNEKFFAVIKERIRHPKTSRIRMICTPWHEQDIAGTIRLNVENGRQTRWICSIDEFAIKDDADGKAVPVWDNGGEFDSGYFEDKKIELGNLYTMNYRLLPVTESDKIVRGLHYYVHDKTCDALFANAERWLSIDPATTVNKTSSDTGILEMVLSPTKHGFCSAAWSFKKNAPDLQKWITDQVISQGVGGYAGMLMECESNIRGMIDLMTPEILASLKKAGWADGQFQVIRTGTRLRKGGQKVSKERRLREAAPYLQNGAIKFRGIASVNKDLPPRPEANTIWDRLDNAVVNFGQTTDEDMVDALSQFVLLFSDKLNGVAKIEDWNSASTKCIIPASSNPFTRALQEQIKASMEKTDDSTAYGEEETFLGAIYA